MLRGVDGLSFWRVFVLLGRSQAVSSLTHSRLLQSKICSSRSNNSFQCQFLCVRFMDRKIVQMIVNRTATLASSVASERRSSPDRTFARPDISAPWHLPHENNHRGICPCLGFNVKVVVVRDIRIRVRILGLQLGLWAGVVFGIRIG